MTAHELIKALLPEAPYIESILRAAGWAHEEIDKAQDRHGERGKGLIWNSFLLLQATHDKLFREVLYRAHCREILDRVARDEDTRPGTDAEIIIGIHEASLVAPMTSGAACLYFRLLDRSVPELSQAAAPDIDLAAYEKVHGRVADEYEADLRRKLRQESRKK
ncbi:hypothetical protein ACH4YO_40670 [Streptomyces noursei]|uniref:hypothetical protein n=1 Tax=Streptomyces noursei TaxID=1971 RepID=UPI00081CCB02|nr:hypothetical protein SNOUR_00060 [Streptomyces noursei ATCC 11455]ANZ22000.1 hypothetical protein SNOUR_43890 [Streptomyces noursei ATCC 11455]MCZ0996418.1 hypothetical protein [Streptomyces noursei]